MKNTVPIISISIVSHNQGLLIAELLSDLEKHCAKQIEVILTINTKENLPFTESDFSFPVCFIQNKEKKGFGTNHNQAFEHAKGNFFCVLNPDIRLNTNPFPALIGCFEDKTVGLTAPLIKDENGKIAENARKFPTLFILFKKLLHLKKKYDYSIGSEIFSPDWVGGMFMLFPCKAFQQIGGFDEKYFLYYEDVDLCARLTFYGYKIIHYPFVSAIHKARYDSHHNIRYLIWHIFSIIRFFTSNAYLKTVLNKFCIWRNKSVG
ncbi:MAG: glycosyltransferase family 2 protein [Thermodesulfobacteriota bacterium]|nr:glycosyltransferase family 2 protein [Thermodesulfobacteriota bacterium]